MVGVVGSMSSLTENQVRLRTTSANWTHTGSEQGFPLHSKTVLARSGPLDKYNFLPTRGGIAGKTTPKDALLSLCIWILRARKRKLRLKSLSTNDLSHRIQAYAYLTRYRKDQATWDLDTFGIRRKTSGDSPLFCACWLPWLSVSPCASFSGRRIQVVGER